MMFSMGTGPMEESPLHPRSKAIESLTGLLVSLTGRQPAPDMVGQVVDDLVAWSNHTVMNSATVVIEEQPKKRKGADDGINSKPV